MRTLPAILSARSFAKDSKKKKEFLDSFFEILDISKDSVWTQAVYDEIMTEQKLSKVKENDFLKICNSIIGQIDSISKDSTIDHDNDSDEEFNFLPLEEMFGEEILDKLASEDS